MKQQQSAGIVIYRNNNNNNYEYLLLHYASGHWDLPKGKIERDETKEEAALRELHEETGLTGTIIPGFQEQLSYIFTDYDGLVTHKMVYFFIGKSNDQSIVLSHEHQGFIWLPYEQALQRLTYSNAEDILKKAYLFIAKIGKVPSDNDFSKSVPTIPL